MTILHALLFLTGVVAPENIELKDGVLIGHMRNGANQQPCRFTRLAAIRPEHYSGLYSIEPV